MQQVSSCSLAAAGDAKPEELPLCGRDPCTALPSLRPPAIRFSTERLNYIANEMTFAAGVVQTRSVYLSRPGEMATGAPWSDEVRRGGSAPRRAE
ncbi:hypothetical protein E2C01_080038 [Portunus trituberculatus]|uniref:Uncharacterized protein n=1 Tax=Portunus trituberculatus TaxID=210409 RepID=A0A5B7IIG4_PORTR|nr:hypothetical protein [Portunus trituberculatus]